LLGVRLAKQDVQESRFSFPPGVGIGGRQENPAGIGIISTLVLQMIFCLNLFLKDFSP